VLEILHRVYQGQGPDKHPRAAFVITTLLLVGSTFAVSLTVTDLEVVLGVFGSIATTSVSLTLPGLYYYLLAKEGEVAQRALGMSVVVAEVVLSALCLYGTFM
jgi:amino acid permease